MAKTITSDMRAAFYQAHRTSFDDCAKRGLAVYTAIPLCSDLVDRARITLGYSAKTSTVDIYRALFRGYKKWKAKQ